jgi:hypothetical protein
VKDGGIEDALEQLDGSGFTRLRGKARAEAIRKMLAAPSTIQIEDLCAVLTQDLDDAATDQKALDALLAMGGKRLVPAAAALLEHPQPAKRVMAVRLLGASGLREEAMPLILKAAGAPAVAGNPDGRHALVAAFAGYRDPRSRAALGSWAQDARDPDSARLARLTLGLLGESAFLGQTLDDCDAVHAARLQLAHDIEVYAAYWTPSRMSEAKRQLFKYQVFMETFPQLLASLDAAGMQAVAEHLRQATGSVAADILYVSLGRLVTPANHAAFVPLLDAPYPALQEELARVLTERGGEPALETVRRTLRSKESSASPSDRALLVRLLDLFPETERAAILAKAASDSSADVVEEALRAALAHGPAGGAAVASAVRANPRWQADGRIRSLLDGLPPPGAGL